MLDYKSNIAISDFRKSLQQQFNQFILQQQSIYLPKDCLRIDLHCHDHNSDKPDELWGRILQLPETWLKTKKLLKTLKKNGCNAYTITNHNNALSCWQLLEKGQDVLVGAEFTCYFPEYNLFIHVLTYGFTPQQETILNNKRQNIYHFLHYTTENDIPVILPHPLYFYTRNSHIDIALFEKLSVMFQRYEVINGQRDQWQSILTLDWTQTLTEEVIVNNAKKHNLNPEDFNVSPSQAKILTGGSDDHMGMFAGQSGTNLYVPNLTSQLKYKNPSELALTALKANQLSAYGHVAENQKLNVALLDYFSQVATKIKDPGLLRILFHRGENSDKIACFVLSNLLLEMQKHKNTQKFFGLIHHALQGKKPGKLVKWRIKKDYHFCINALEDIAKNTANPPEEFILSVNRSIPKLYKQLNLLMIKRLTKSGIINTEKRLKNFSTAEITKQFEIPSQLTNLLVNNNTQLNGMSHVNFGALLDNLSFPLLISTFLLGTTMASTRLLYQNRQFLNTFSASIGKNKHPKRALYLTDTLKDKNGVSNSLSAKLKEIQKSDLPIDFLICHPDAKPEPHLHVIKPLTSFSLSDFGEQQFRIPDIMEIGMIFYQGAYDRIICSTEGPMAFASLFIKHMFNVPSYFFMHTDWLDFIKHTTDLNQHERDRVRRFLRFFYQQYSGIFVLNKEHKEWLTGHNMQLDKKNVFLTAHHTQARNENIKPLHKKNLFKGADENTPVLLFASRLSKEKGIYDLPKIFSMVKKSIANIKLVIAGSGPEQKQLKKLLPEAVFLGWVDKKTIFQLYNSLDLMIFPSRFDTFGNVILEAFVNGMPVISYNCKGPKDIIEHNISGYLVEDEEQMSKHIISFINDPEAQKRMKKNAMLRSSKYQAEPIMQQFIHDLGLVEQTQTSSVD
ncbi:MAG: glycosyltransferase [Pseudomonadota bacterium]